MFIIKFILLVFLIGFVVVLMTVVMTWLKLRGTINQFRQQMNGGSDGGSRASATSGGGVHDERTPEQAGRKIIPKDEGEYVDYKEV